MQAVFEIPRETAWWYLSLRCLKNAVFETRCFDCTTQLDRLKVLVSLFFVLGIFGVRYKYWFESSFIYL